MGMEEHPESQKHDDYEDIAWMEMQRNVYSAGIASVVQQIGVAFPGEVKPTETAQVVRLFIAASVILLAVGMQLFLVWRVKELVCAGAVHSIRQVYSVYEKHMYSRTHLTVNGFYRGSGHEFFLPGKFESLDDEVKRTVCQVPLSQPDFLSAILFIWSMTVFAEIRRCFAWAYRFLCVTGTSSEVHVLATRPVHTQTGPSTLHQKAHDSGIGYGLGEGESGLLALSMTVKAFIGLLFVVQAGTALGLLWIGCRWLLATTDFSDLILNGLALAFIVEIKDMLYDDVLPRLFQHETEAIRVMREPLRMNCHTLATPIIWTAISATWVGVYMAHFQQVLPEYQWDIKGPCTEFLREFLHV
jgi:hypothetical protein